MAISACSRRGGLPFGLSYNRSISNDVCEVGFLVSKCDVASGTGHSERICVSGKSDDKRTQKQKEIYKYSMNIW